MIARLRSASFRYLVAVAALVVAGLSCAGAAKAQQSQERTWCYDEKSTADQTIAGCTTMIRSGRETMAVQFYNRGIAWRRRGDNDNAIADYTEAIRLNPNHVSAFKNRGHAYFYAANFGAAASDFARNLQEKPDDGYSVMWLYLARARSGSQNASKELETNAAQLKQSDWPYPVIELYLWRRTPEEILAATSKPDERCEALFYVGEWHLLRGDQATAAPTLKAAADTCPKTFIEYTGAQAELKRLGP